MSRRIRQVMLIAGTALILCGCWSRKDTVQQETTFGPMLDAGEWAAEFETDHPSAVVKYDSHNIVVKGEVLETGIEKETTVVFVRLAATADTSVFCAFRTSDKAVVDSLRRGHTIKVRGSCTGLVGIVDNELNLSLCRLTE